MKPTDNVFGNVEKWFPFMLPINPYVEIWSRCMHPSNANLFKELKLLGSNTDDNAEQFAKAWCDIVESCEESTSNSNLINDVQSTNADVLIYCNEFNYGSDASLLQFLNVYFPIDDNDG